MITNLAEMIDSLSLGSGALLIAALSGIFSLLYFFIHNTLFKWVLVLLVPFFLAYSVYWTPVWFAHHLSGEYSSWEGLFIVPWYGAGVFASVLVCYLIGKVKHNKIK